MMYNIQCIQDEILRTKSEIKSLRTELVSMYDPSPQGSGKLDTDFKDDYEPILSKINDLKAHLHYATDCLEVFSKFVKPGSDSRKATFEVEDTDRIKANINSSTDRMISMKQIGLLDSNTESKFKAEIKEYKNQLKEAEKLEKVVSKYDEFYEQCYRLSHSSHAIRSKLYRR